MQYYSRRDQSVTIVPLKLIRFQKKRRAPSWTKSAI
jgi:hypothetical protein